MLSLSSFDPSGFKVWVERRIFTGDNKKKSHLKRKECLQIVSNARAFSLQISYFF